VHTFLVAAQAADARRPGRKSMFCHGSGDTVYRLQQLPGAVASADLQVMCQPWSSKLCSVACDICLLVEQLTKGSCRTVESVSACCGLLFAGGKQMVGNQVGSPVASRPGTEGHHSLGDKVRGAMHGRCDVILSE
jgi:hypothetical protein